MLTAVQPGDNANATGADSATFEITDAELYVPIVTLSIEDNAKLSEGFKRSIYWNKYKAIDNGEVNIARNIEEKYIRKLLDSSNQGVKRLFALAHNNTAGNNQICIDSFKIYFLPRVKIKTSKITTSKLMEEIFMINQLMNQLSNTTNQKNINRTR